jgi:hypothetical protein
MSGSSASSVWSVLGEIVTTFISLPTSEGENGGVISMKSMLLEGTEIDPRMNWRRLVQEFA